MDQPWLNEPYYMHGVRHGYTYIAVRHPKLRHWCGYLLLNADHPWVVALQNAVPDPETGWHNVSADQLCDVHGGVTYSGTKLPEHIKAPVEYAYVFGFDCAHAADVAPGMLPYVKPMPGMVYRDLTFAVQQCKHMAEQAAAACNKERTDDHKG